MIDTLTSDNLTGNFEAWKEDEDKAIGLKAQAKVITDGINDTIADYAKEIEAPLGDVKASFARWKKLKIKGEPVSDSLYTLFALVDECVETEEDDK